MIPITVKGNTYKSISQAWRHESPDGLPQITVRVRLKLGWHPDDAFTLPKVDPQQRRKFPEVRNK